MAIGVSDKASTLAPVLDNLTSEGVLYDRLENHKVRCYACGHRCLIPAGRRGICKVRFNRDGTLYVPRNYVAALQCDPTEKKPFYHLLPGSNTLTFGMLGCDFHCGYCQNWLTSQALRDKTAGLNPEEISAPQLVKLARRHGAKVVGSSYNEPLITSEWAVEIFQLARQEGFYTAYVSNGNATREVLQYLRPWTDGYKIDLKTMNPRHYRSLGGVLKQVLETIAMAYEMGFWLEVVTLLVPGFNDSEAEIRETARFLADISPTIPWHVTAFHQDYKMQEADNTPLATLTRAAEIGYEVGLKFVYAGNRPGRVDSYENTYCPQCSMLLIERFGFHLVQDRLNPAGQCPSCGYAVPGIWK